MPKYSVLIDIANVDYPGEEWQLIDHFKAILARSSLNLNGNIVAIINEDKKKQAPPFWNLPPKEQEEQMKNIGLTPPIGPDEEK